MSELLNIIQKYLCNLSPHVATRMTPRLLQKAADEIERLQREAVLLQARAESAESRAREWQAAVVRTETLAAEKMTAMLAEIEQMRAALAPFAAIGRRIPDLPKH